MDYASSIAVRLVFSEIVGDRVSLPPRDVKNFYRAFFKIFWFTRLIISDDLREKITKWNQKFAEDRSKASVIQEGVNLYILFADELAKNGFITYFEGSITPDFLDDGLSPEEEKKIAKRMRELDL